LDTGVESKDEFRKSRVEPEDIMKIQNIVKKNVKSDMPKLHKKLDFSLPVKFKSPDHFKLSSIIAKLMSNAKKDMESNNEDKAMENLNLVKYYLTKIEY
jgi:hypothetical protein